MPNDEGRAHPLGRLVRTIARGPVLGLRTALETERVRHAFPLPPFEDRVWQRSIEGDAIAPIPADLVDAASADGAMVFIDTLVPTRHGRPRLTTERGVYRDGAVLMHEALNTLPRGTSVSFLAPASTLSLATHAPLRREIVEEHGFSWLIFIGGTMIEGLHSALSLAVIVCEVGTTSDNHVRFVDLRGREPAKWEREVRSASKRAGGEIGRSIVLPQAQLGDDPWLYERYTKAYHASRADLTAIGELLPLDELVESIVTGLVPRHSPVQLQPVGEEEFEPPAGTVPLLGGREVTPTGIVTPGHYWAEAATIPEKCRVRAGDVLFRTITRGPGLVATVAPSGLAAAFAHSVLRLRWKPEVPTQVRELLVAWLSSERATQAIEVSMLGDILRLTGSALRRLEVPYPSEKVMAALSGLSENEAWYRSRANAALTARHAVFAAKTYAESVPLLLEAQRAEGERVTAAEDSQRFEYRVRNYFPHPIALRRERLEVLPHGKERLGEALECAEHLVHYLALCGLVQLHTMNPEAAIPSKSLASTAKDGALRMTWGTSWQVLREAVASTTRASDVLALPIPQLTLLEGLTTKNDTPGSRAEAMLRNQRNSESHLHRMPEPDLRELSESVSAALDEMLEAVRFLADLPLVFVRDYAIDPFTGERSALFEFLRGASVVFERRRQRVKEELPRGCLGLLRHDGRFHRLAPWLHLHTCELCKRPEVFVFNRKERAAVTYVAMETGHPWEDPRMVEVFDRLLNGA